MGHVQEVVEVRDLVLEVGLRVLPDDLLPLAVDEHQVASQRLLGCCRVLLPPQPLLLLALPFTLLTLP